METVDALGFAPIGLDEPYGVFMTKDPLGEYGDVNLYRANNNNAVNYIDPDGRFIMPLLQRLAMTPAAQRALSLLQNSWQRLMSLGSALSQRAASSSLCRVSFGHGARHLEGTGLNPDAVESTIVNNIQSAVQGASETGSFWGSVQVDGQTILYRAYTLTNGVINVGTYYPPR